MQKLLTLCPDKMNTNGSGNIQLDICIQKFIKTACPYSRMLRVALLVWFEHVDAKLEGLPVRYIPFLYKIRLIS